MPPSPSSVGPPVLAQVAGFGHTVELVTLLLLALFLSQLPSRGANRRMMRHWIAAFLALAVASSVLAAVSGIFGLGLHLTEAQSNFSIVIIDAFQLLFTALATLAAIGASGRRVPARLPLILGLLTLALGFGVGALGVLDWALVLATPILFTASAQLLLAAARGDRQRGLSFLASAMMVFAIAWTAVQLVETLFPPLSPDGFLRVLHQLRHYVLALCELVLGGAIAVLVVRDSVLEVARTREEYLRDVGASEARLKRIIEAAGEAILTFSRDRLVEMANGAAARLFRLPAAGLVGRRLDDLIELEAGSWDDSLMPALSAGAHQATFTGTGRRPDDASFPLELTVGSLAGGEPLGAGGVAIVRDLSQRLAAEAERDRFERRIAESEKMLAIGRVVSGVAHELNNPLAVVLGQSEQLVAHGDDEELREGMRLINEQAHRARHIVKDLLAFVRHREDHREPVSLVDLVGRVVAAQAGEAQEAGVTVEIEPATDAPLALVDRLALEQVLVNLLDNAMDATGQGGVVRLSVGHRGGLAEVRVEDDGPGVPEGLQGRIFEPFFTTKPTGQGTGLGLSVSVGLLEQLGGRLALENRPAPGVGARFVVQVPLAPEHLAAGRTESPTEFPVVLLRDGRPGHAMVIDDEPAVRITLGRIFRRWGWSVQEHGEAEVALAILCTTGHQSPDVLLCDLRMPGMSGEEFYEALLRARPEYRERVVFVTGDMVEPDTARFLATAGRLVVEKPFTIAEIAETVERIVLPA